MSATKTITTVSGNTFTVYTRETEHQRIVMVTDKDGIEHTSRNPRSFTFEELINNLLEEVENAS